MDKVERWLERAYEAGGNRDTLDRLYDEWARDYDRHIWSTGNPYIAIATGMVGRHIQSFEASILDAGCGTGNMAQVLHQMGYQKLDGLDPSAGMLAAAREKGVYQALHKLALGGEVDLPDESYDAVVASGVLTHGHAPPESLDGIVKLVKPNGVIIFSLSEIAGKEQGFNEKLAELERNSTWIELDRSRLFRTYPFLEREAHVHHWICVYRKL